MTVIFSRTFISAFQKWELRAVKHYIFHVPCINQMYTNFLKRPTNAPQCMNAILLHRNHKRVSATHVAIFWVARTRILFLLLQMALQPGVCLGLRYNMPPGLSVPCSISPFLHTHLSQVHRHVIQSSHSWSSSSSCCIQLSVQHLFLGLRCLAFFLYAQAIVFFGI